MRLAPPLALALLLAALLGGCVSRKLFLKTEPPGASVMLDGKHIGSTPWEGDFGSYGTRKVELELPGYARRIEVFEIPTPWWQYPGLAVVTDLVLPWTINDDHSFSWALTPIDPEAGTWEDAYAVQRRMEALH